MPDRAGWRRERMPDYPDTAYFTLAPDWVCEVLSASTRRLDLREKRPDYAREGVAHRMPRARPFKAPETRIASCDSPANRHAPVELVPLPPCLPCRTATSRYCALASSITRLRLAQ